MRAAALVCLLLLAAAAPAAVGQSNPVGLARITLQGRQGCSKRGLLAAQSCGKSTSLSLSPGAPTTLTTWLIENAPGPLPGGLKAARPVPVTLKVQGRATCPAASLVTGNLGCDNKNIFLGSGSRFVLEKVTPGINLYRIRMQGRTTGGCTRTYLGAARATGSPGKDCGDPKISVYSASDPSALTVWRIDVLPPPPARRPPPKVQPARINPPPQVLRAPPPPRRAPPPPRRSSPPLTSPPPAPNGDGTCLFGCPAGKLCWLGQCTTVAPFSLRLRWFDDIDLDLELFAPNGCHMYYDYRGPVDCDCRSLGTFLEFDCRTLKECPLGMQEYIPIKSPLFGNYTVRVHDFDKVNQGAAFALFIYRDGVEERIDANVDYSCPGYPESKCITVLYP